MELESDFSCRSSEEPLFSNIYTTKKGDVIMRLEKCETKGERTPWSRPVLKKGEIGAVTQNRLGLGTDLILLES